MSSAGIFTETDNIFSLCFVDNNMVIKHLTTFQTILLTKIIALCMLYSKWNDSTFLSFYT